MHMFRKALFVAFCAAFSAPVLADDVVSFVVQNFPYQEVDESYGTTKIEQGQCQEGTPFPIFQEGFDSDAKMDVAKRIHERVRSLGANAFVMIDVAKDTRGRSIMVTPLTCDLR